MNKPASVNIEPIKRLAKHKSRDLKVNVILALDRTHDEQVEPLMLEIFKGTKDSHIKNMICIPLQTIGTAKAITVLEEEYRKIRDFGLIDRIEFTIESIKKGNMRHNQDPVRKYLQHSPYFNN